MAQAPATTPRRRADGPTPAIELTLLSRVAFRDQETTGPRLRGLLALLAGDLRTGASTARLVEGLWPDELPEHPAKALQVVVSRARAQVGADELAAERLAEPGRPDRRLGWGDGHAPLVSSVWPWWPRPSRGCTPPGSARFHRGFSRPFPRTT
jgi:hypothetical protein